MREHYDFFDDVELGFSPAAYFSSDSNPSTWEYLEASWLLPVNTTYVKVTLRAHEDVFNNTSSPEFDGHFADNVVANVIPEPGVLGLLLLGVFGIRWFSRR